MSSADLAHGNSTQTADDSGLRSVLDSIIDPFFVLAPVEDADSSIVDFRYRDLNPAACAFGGVRRDEVIGRRVLEVHASDRARALHALCVSAYQSFEPVALDGVPLPSRDDGAERFVDFHANRVGDLLHCTLRDVTARVIAVRELARSETMFRLLAENSSDVVYLRDFDGIVTWVSPSITDVLGWDPESTIGKRASELVHPDDLPGVAERQRELATTGRVGGELVRVRRSDGGYRVMSVTARALVEEAAGISGVVVGLRDVDELVRQREAAEFEAAQREAVVRTLLDPHVLLLAVRDDEGRIVDFVYDDANEAACRYNHRTLDELIGARLTDVVPAHRDPTTLAIYADVIETGEPLVEDDYQFHVASWGSQPRYFDIRAVRVGDYVSLTWRDVTDRHQTAAALAASEERYRMLAENSSDVVLRTQGNTVMWVSPALTRTLGWSPEEWIGQSMTQFGFEGDGSVLEEGYRQLLSDTPVILRVRVADRTGTYRWIELHSQLYHDPDGREDGVLSTFRVVDAEVAVERELERRARFDDLTGVLKRDEAIDRLTELGRHQRSPGDACGVLFVDIDEFKTVNDRWGHAAGDAVLREVTARLRRTVRGGDEIARLGGDEFLVMLGGMHDLVEAEQVAEKIRLAIAEPMVTTGGAVTITVSIGVTVSTSVESGSAMITRADDAMYEAKRAGRNRVVAVSPDAASVAAGDRPPH
jgi:diguanylate cyclase (GGDEF)-like protein/PAS domain S-box-containing protein